MRKILVAHDGSASADKALLEAADMAQEFGAAVTIISVVPNLCFSEIGVDCETVNTLYRAEVEGIMNRIKAMDREMGIKAETLILEGNPPDVIADYAKGMGMDLLVVGSTGKHATGRTILGSVSSRIIANSPCSVLVVK